MKNYNKCHPMYGIPSNFTLIEGEFHRKIIHMIENIFNKYN